VLRWLIALVVLTAACSGNAGDSSSGNGSAADEPAPTDQESRTPDPTRASPTAVEFEQPQLTGETVAATVLDVIDGDTIDVAIGGVEERIRYPAINSPERGACLEDEATAANAEFLAGKTVVLERDPEGPDRDRYGRLLRYVWADNALVDFHLVGLGLAEVQTQYPQKKYLERLLAVQSAARSAGVGVWGLCDGVFE
jgi:micrococcal nuclease